MEKLNVLLVDDENIVIEDMSSLIDWEAAGFHLSGFAYNGTQARKAMQKCPADIVFMDILTPMASAFPDNCVPSIQISSSLS